MVSQCNGHGSTGTLCDGIAAEDTKYELAQRMKCNIAECRHPPHFSAGFSPQFHEVICQEATKAGDRGLVVEVATCSGDIRRRHVLRETCSFTYWLHGRPELTRMPTPAQYSDHSNTVVSV